MTMLTPITFTATATAGPAAKATAQPASAPATFNRNEHVARLKALVGDLEDELAELDVNPLIVTGDRKSSFVVDARIALSP